MDRTLLASRLFGTITTTVQPLESIIQQLLTTRTEFRIALLFPTIQTYHLFNYRFLFFYSSVYILERFLYFHDYVTIGPFSFDVIGKERCFATAFQDMAFTTQFAVMKAFPFMQHEIETLFPSRLFNSWRYHNIDSG